MGSRDARDTMQNQPYFSRYQCSRHKGSWEIRDFQGESEDLKSRNHTDAPINKETPEDLDQAEKRDSKYVILED